MIKAFKVPKVQILMPYLLFFKMFRLFPEGPLKYPCLSSLKWQNHKILSNFAKNQYFPTKFGQRVYFGDWNLLEFLKNEKCENFPIFPDFPRFSDFSRKMTFYHIFYQKDSIIRFNVSLISYCILYYHY